MADQAAWKKLSCLHEKITISERKRKTCSKKVRAVQTDTLKTEPLVKFARKKCFQKLREMLTEQILAQRHRTSLQGIESWKKQQTLCCLWSLIMCIKQNCACPVPKTEEH